MLKYPSHNQIKSIVSCLISKDKYAVYKMSTKALFFLTTKQANQKEFVLVLFLNVCLDICVICKHLFKY